jgi:membrane-associated protein
VPEAHDQREFWTLNKKRRGAMEIVQMVLHFDQFLGTAIAQYGTAVYLLLFLIVFCEIGIAPLFFLPGDPLLFICGAFCATGALNPWILAPTLFVATIAGSGLAFTIGSALGHKVFSHDFRWLHKESLNKTARFYERHGGPLLLFSPYIAVVRTFAPFLAGVFELKRGRFFKYTVIGAALWVSILIVGGDLFGNIPVVRDHLSLILLSGVALGCGTIAGGALLRFARGRAGR